MERAGTFGTSGAAVEARTKHSTRAAIWSGRMVALARRGLVNAVVRADRRAATRPAVRGDAVGKRIGWPTIFPLATSSRYRIPGIENIPPWNVARFAGAYRFVWRCPAIVFPESKPPFPGTSIGSPGRTSSIDADPLSHSRNRKKCLLGSPPARYDHRDDSR
jgi:hypothetical protein